MTRSHPGQPSTTTSDAANAVRPTDSSRKRFLKQALAAAGLAAVGMKTAGEKTVQAATVFGDAVAGSGPFGLRVRNSSSSANVAAIRGELRSTTSGAGAAGIIGGNAGTNNTGIGVLGTHAGGGIGVRGTSQSGKGVVGQSFAFTGVGVHGIANGGYDAIGVKGTVKDGVGVAGESTEGNGTAVSGVALGDGGYGVGGNATGVGGVGVAGISPSGTAGLFQSIDGYGVDAQARFIAVRGLNYDAQNDGQLGTEFEGVYAKAGGDNSYAVYAFGGTGSRGALRALGGGTSPAAEFAGAVDINGSLTVTGAKSFLIDHPLDPSNQLLAHAAIESHEMLNDYSGNTTLDSDGTAVVELPHWFDAINRDCRYSLTAIGAAQRDLHIAEEVRANSFRIAGGASGGKVSWRVTALRSDAWARSNPLEVERAKPEAERGTYLQPEVHGKPANLGRDTLLLRARAARMSS